MKLNFPKSLLLILLTLIALFAMNVSGIAKDDDVSEADKKSEKVEKSLENNDSADSNKKKEPKKNNAVEEGGKEEIKALTLEELAKDTLKNIAELRGLKSKRDVAVAAMDRDGLYQYLKSNIERDLIDSDLKKYDELAARMGLQPEGIDTKELFLQFLKRGVGGFYDPQTKKYYLIQEKDSTNYDKATMAHELIHALQDQHFDLMKMPTNKHDNSDVGAAMKCVIEGDAKYTELLYMKKYLDKNEDRVWLTSKQDQMGIYIADKAGGIFIDKDRFKQPQIQFMIMIYKMQMYSYFQGCRFVKAVHDKGGWDAVNHLYEDWPKSTEQIIHPEKYLDKDKRDDPHVINSKDFILWMQKQGYEYITSDVAGELAIDRLILNFVGRETINAEEVGAGWEGDRFVGFINKRTKKSVVSWLSLWETEKDAEEMATAMTTIFQKRFGKPSEDDNLSDNVVCSKEGRITWVERQGHKVLFVDGESLEATKKIVKEAKARSTIEEIKSKNFWVTKTGTKGQTTKDSKKAEKPVDKPTDKSQEEMKKVPQQASGAAK